MSPRSPRTSVFVVLSALAGLLALAGPVRGQEADPAAHEIRRVVYDVAPIRDGEIELEMDLYVPRNRPVEGAVVLLHGGAFVTGSREIDENRAYGEALAGRGYLAAAVSYRLHGDAPVLADDWARAYSRRVRGYDDPLARSFIQRHGPAWSDAVAAAGEDLLAAVVWLRRHADELGFEPEDVALFGASAGSITSLTAAYALDEYGGANLEVAGVIDLRGLLLHPTGEGNPLEGGGPPLMIVHGEDDQRVSLAYAESVFRLARDAGLHVELYTVPGYGHELGGAELLRLKLDPARTVLYRVDAFLARAFSDDAPPATSLRARMFEPDHRVEPGGNGASGAEADRTSEFRAELERAVTDLVRSVREGDDPVPALYGLSRPDLLVHEFDDPERMDWSYWPRSRTGLPLRHMTAAQRGRTHRVLATLLSAKGYLQVNHVMMLEEVLAELETVGFARGAEEYVIALFGLPSRDEPWGLRFEGHHVSLNVTLTPRDVSVTPSFLGASPAPLQTGIRAGFNPLAHEQRYAVELLESLDERQRAAAILSDRPPHEVLTSQFRVDRSEWDRWPRRLSRDGISASTFDPDQRRTLRRLLGAIARTYREEIGGAWLDSVDLDALAFAWMGATEIGRPHYFRIQGEGFVFELDTAQGDGTHVHTVWRDREGDLGADALRAHYREHRHRAGSSSDDSS